MIELLFAVLAGILTVGAPCILPMLPILLGTTVGQQSKLRPVFITLGFIIAFAIVAFLFGLFTNILGLSPQALRTVAVVMLAIFGIFMVWPTPFEKLTTYLSGFINSANSISQKAGNGNFGALILGLMLGVIWTPCAGPVLGSILTLIATKQDLFNAALLLLAYSIGAGIPLLLVGYGGQYVTTKVRFIAQYSRRIQQVFGVLILGLALAIHLQYDTVIQAKLLQYIPVPSIQLPGTETKKQGSEFGNFGPAPEFTGINEWLNAEPQRMADLKGKVVLVDFWTYSCINCVRTLPYVTEWYDKYKDDGFVVIGVHTPEFAFEKDTDNVEKAIDRFNINYPVAQDNDYRTWTAYKNNAWPAHYLIDKEGNIVYKHFGEGNYDITENNIRTLLGLSGDASTNMSLPNFKAIQTPEIYFGLSRQEYISNEERITGENQLLQYPNAIPDNTFAVSGSWKFNSESAILIGDTGKIKLQFGASKVYMVAQSATPATIKILIDGQFYKEVAISASDIYTLFESDEYKNRQLEIEIPQKGFEVFTFTFG